MISVTKQFSFEASHHLRMNDVSDEENRVVYGPCYNDHGHSFKLFVTVTGPTRLDGMIINYKDLGAIVDKEIISKLDHHCLNQVFDEAFPMTSENLIKWMADVLQKCLPVPITLYKLDLYETEKCHATWENIAVLRREI